MTLANISLYLLVFSMAVIFMILIKKSHLISGFFFYFLKLLSPFIYASLCIPLYVFEFGDKIWLNYDGEKEFNFVNLLWIFPMIALNSINIIYYYFFYAKNDKDLNINIISNRVCFKYTFLKGVFHLTLTLGVSLFIIIISHTRFRENNLIGLLFIFVLLLSINVYVSMFKPYKMFYHNNIESLTYNLCLLLLFLGINQSYFKNKSSDDETIVLVNLINFLIVIAAILILIGVWAHYYFKYRKENNGEITQNIFMINQLDNDDKNESKLISDIES